METIDQKIAIRLVKGRGHEAMLELGSGLFPCSIGPGGTTVFKAEGDGATPVGCWAMRCLFYRPDRVLRPKCRLPVRALQESDGWCDDPASNKYNQLVELPLSKSHEKLWRKDHLYDLIVVLGHNDSPPIAGKGSAIFMHLRADDGGPTQGCIALAKPHLLHLLSVVTPETKICVFP